MNKNSPKETNKLIIHVDVDSPVKLLNFYKIENIKFNEKMLEEFYCTAWDRILEFFDKRGLKVTFFVVGDELHNETIRKIILKAYSQGHEIENHTYSHPFGLTRLSDDKIKEEITLCSDQINKITGQYPVGFRSPGYNINTKIINILESLNFKYDSSGFYSIMNIALKASQKVLFKNGVNNGDFGGVNSKLGHAPYFPDNTNWLIKGAKRGIIELPLPRTNILGLPFYNNFNLWTPSVYTNYIAKRIKRSNIVYLFHIIEFMDMTDNIPGELSIHPNLKRPVKEKINKSYQFLDNLLNHYEHIPTKQLVKIMNN
jgi:peptidoglycan/xylan/chitin deacetylase (PgdA/CDA1 family)